MRLQSRTVVLEKLKESVSSVLPITGIVFLLCFTIVPVSAEDFLSFIFGSVLLMLGMTLFNLGTDMAMTPIGEHIGSSVTKSRSLWFIILVSFLVGLMVTISEPDLTILAEQISTIPNMVLILSVAAGVGIFMIVAVLRILLRVPLSYLLLGLYCVIFILSIFVPKNFIALAFDSGGVTTGPMTVPFIMALGSGIASIRSDRGADNDSFGMVALGSVGPIIAVMILGLVYPTDDLVISTYTPSTGNSRDLIVAFVKGLPDYLGEVGIALLPIVAFFILFQIFRIKMKRAPFIRICIGVLYTFTGLGLFLTGANVGFMPLGDSLGQNLGQLSYNWIVVPIGMLIGYFIVMAEPAVHVLNKQVYEITSGAIPKKAMSTSLGIGVACSIGLSMLRILLHIPIMYVLIPGYAIAMILTFLVPKIFTSIAFDSGGVASGTMTATFLLPLTMGVCTATGGDIATEAFGMVALVAMTPLITIQLLGLIYKIKTARAEKARAAEPPVTEDIIS